ncbi:hypothetical protein [Paenibacillus periandrae]|uniref:hypothetical protein n=1 Tax=Paenibacillus periandrae TaxID=1761741 RepID=UPI001F096D8C|nr:hypothetical protein [Paenibacillus periandrae]
MQDLIKELTKAQQKNLLELYDWHNRLGLTIGRGSRTGRYLVEKGLAIQTGDVFNYAYQYQITDLGMKVVDYIRGDRH